VLNRAELEPRGALREPSRLSTYGKALDLWRKSLLHASAPVGYGRARSALLAFPCHRGEKWNVLNQRYAGVGSVSTELRRKATARNRYHSGVLREAAQEENNRD